MFIVYVFSACCVPSIVLGTGIRRVICKTHDSAHSKCLVNTIRKSRVEVRVCEKKGQRHKKENRAKDFLFGFGLHFD